MEMQRVNEIGQKLFEEVLSEKYTLKDIRNMERKIGNFLKGNKISISKKELLEYTRIVFKRLLKREIVNLNKKKKLRLT